MTAALWSSRMARLILDTPDGRRDVLLDAPVTVIVDGRWLTLKVGETKAVRSESGTYRVATEADVLGSADV